MITIFVNLYKTGLHQLLTCHEDYPLTDFINGFRMVDADK
jgi:hypothetical protein